MKYLKGETVKIAPNEAREHGDKLKLVDMKKSLYRVLEGFEVKKKVKRVTRQNPDKE